MLRRIFECTRARDGMWRMKGNVELNDLIVSKNVINYIKAQRFSWFGHVHRMTNDGMVKKICKWKPISARLAGRPKIGWENIIKEALRIMRVNNWTMCIQDGVNGRKHLRRQKKTFKR